MNITFDEDLLELQGVEERFASIAPNRAYKYNGRNVPRVTHIIRQNTDNEYLIKMAAGLGYRKYNDVMEKAVDVGSAVHELIEDYMNYKYINNMEPPEPNYSKYNPSYTSEIYTAYNNFLLWIKIIEELGVKIEEVIGTEIPIITPWYGGTIDLIVKINGAIYIIDWKTSKKISFNYMVQIAAYMWAVNNKFCPENIPPVDGIGILRFDKSISGKFNDVFLNNFVTEQRLMIEQYQMTFRSYIESYYRSINAEFITDNYNYNMTEFFKR